MLRRIPQLLHLNYKLENTQSKVVKAKPLQNFLTFFSVTLAETAGKNTFDRR